MRIWVRVDSPRRAKGFAYIRRPAVKLFDLCDIIIVIVIIVRHYIFAIIYQISRISSSFSALTTITRLLGFRRDGAGTVPSSKFIRNGLKGKKVLILDMEKKIE